MNVYLVRHGQAKSEQEDPERPLSEKGWSEIKKVAAFVAKKGNISVKDIFHSGKTRALQTAEILTEQLNPSNGISETDGLKPMDDASIWAARIADITEDIMLVGHLPHLDRLAAILLCWDVIKKVVTFRTGSILCIGREESEAWSIRWMVIPDMLS